MKQEAAKVLSTVLAVSMIGGLLAGCQKKQSSGNGSAKTSGPATTMTVEVFDRGTSGEPDLNNNYWTKWINQNFGKKYNVNVQFVSVPRSQEVDKLNVLMAANEAPDLCFTYNAGVVSNYVAQGGLTQMDSAISQNGQTLSKYLGKDVLKYGQFGGKQFSIPGKRTMQMLHANFVRKDWLDKLGMKAPTTLDEFYNMLVAFRDKNPGNVSGGCIPFGVVIGYSTGQLSTGNLAESFLTDFSESTIAKYTTDASGLMWWGMPGFKDYMKFMNKLYNENLISKDFAVDKTNSQRDADTANGKVGVYCNSWDYIYRSTPGIYQTLKKNVSSAELVPVDCFKNAKTGKYTKLEYAKNSAYMIVPKFSKHATQVVQYLNWMADSKVTSALQYGQQGVDYELVDGVPKPNVPSTYTGQKFMGSVCNGDYDMLHNGPEVGSESKNITALSYSYPGYTSDVKMSAQIALKDTFNAFAFTIPNSSYSKYSKSLVDKSNQMMAKLVSCKESDFSNLYDSLLKEYMTAGGQAVVDENVKNYKTQTTKTSK